MYIKSFLCVVFMLSCLIANGCVSSPLDKLFNKNGESKAQQSQQTQLNENFGAKIYISNNPFISVPDLSDKSNQICENGTCYIDPAKVNQTSKFEVVKNGDKDKVITLNGQDVKIPANAYYIVVYTWEKKTFQSTITDVINEISASKVEFGKYLIYGGLAIIVIFGLLGWFTKSYGFIALGLVLGAATAGIAYYPWVSLIIIGLAILGTIGYVIAELRSKSIDSICVKKLNEKIDALNRENKILRGLMDPRDIGLLETQLKD